jgi:hypothetical protein
MQTLCSALSAVRARPYVDEVLDAADTLTILGGVCEASGIVLTVRELVRVEDRAFPERRNRVLRAWRWIERRVLGRHPATVYVDAMEGAAAAEGKLTLSVTRAPAPDDLRARLEWLERVVADHHREHSEAIERVEARVTVVSEEHTRRLADLRSALERERREEREALRDSLTLQWAYALLFAFGAALSTIGGVMS